MAIGKPHQKSRPISRHLASQELKDPELLGALRNATLWQERNASVWSFYCPLCRAPRKLRARPRLGLRAFGQIFLSSLFFTLCLWPLLKWKGLVTFIPLWAAFEFVYRIRVRGLVSCPHCGFDPYLYLQDVKKAKQAVEDHWRGLFEAKGVPFPGDPSVASLAEPAPEAAQSPEKDSQNPS